MPNLFRLLFVAVAILVVPSATANAQITDWWGPLGDVQTTEGTIQVLGECVGITVLKFPISEPNTTGTMVAGDEYMCTYTESGSILTIQGIMIGNPQKSITLKAEGDGIFYEPYELYTQAPFGRPRYYDVTGGEIRMWWIICGD